jgi:transcriptional regulator GlxA family with amidase domain
MAKQIGILLFPGVEELDAVGPWEVFAFWAKTFPQDGYEVCCFSESGGLVECAKGLTISAHHSYADVPALDVLLYPGGQGTRRQLTDEPQLEWLRRQREEVPLLASVCTGALVFAAAGLLENRPATTHWRAVSELAGIDSSIDIRAHDRVVDNGDIVTSAGVSAGIDLALHLVSRLATPERAQQVRRGIQYEPAPA